MCLGVILPHNNNDIWLIVLFVMKKITCFTESLAGGGAEHQMVILAGFLAEKGYDVTIVTYASTPDHYDTPQGVKRIDVGATRAKGKNLKAIIKILKVFHYFLWLKTDCIIAYRECANLRVLPPMLFRNRKLKVICSDRNTSTKLSFRHKLLLHFLYRRADFIVPNSKTETDFIASHKPRLIPKLCTIHNYTDLHQFTASSMPSDTTIVKVAIFSRYSAQKNPIGFAKAMQELKQKTKHSFEVHWYGTQKGNLDGFNKEYLELKEKVKELGVGDVLKLCQPVKNPALLMDDYHAICLPSLFEGFSNSIAEGICSAKPMLVSDVSDNYVMVHEGENGFLFDPNKTDSICNAFLRFFGLSYDEMCKKAHNSRMRAVQLFDKEQFVQQYIDLIES